MKRNIAVNLARLGTVEVVPASTSAADILARDPTASSSATAPATRRWCGTPVDAIAGLIGQVPVFGICLGHQLLGAGASAPAP